MLTDLLNVFYTALAQFRTFLEQTCTLQAERGCWSTLWSCSRCSITLHIDLHKWQLQYTLHLTSTLKEEEGESTYLTRDELGRLILQFKHARSVVIYTYTPQQLTALFVTAETPHARKLSSSTSQVVKVLYKQHVLQAAITSFLSSSKL